MEEGNLEFVDDHVVDAGVEYEELYLQCFDFNLFNEEREGCVGDDAKELPYKLWPGDWEEKN